MKKFTFILLLITLLILSCQKKEERLRTDRTSGLVRELLTKLDSADFYAARKEAEIDACKNQIGRGRDYRENFYILYEVGDKYANFIIDSSLVYFERAAQVATEADDDRLRILAEIRLSTMLTIGGFYMSSFNVINSIPREKLQGSLVERYYNAWTKLYREVYTSSYEPDSLKWVYHDKYIAYRDTLLSVADRNGEYYLRNMERKAAQAGNLAEARQYNAIRVANITDHKSYAYATCLYDRFVISQHYENNLTGHDVDDLLQAAIIELEYCNRDIHSMLCVIDLLNEIEEVKDAKKVSDYYYNSLLRFGSRKRLLECGLQAMTVNEQNFLLLKKRNSEFKIAIVLVSLLAIAFLSAVIMIYRSNRRIGNLRDNLQQQAKVSKGYVGVVFKLYSSYIKRFDSFRMKIYSTLKKGNLDQALDLASPSKDLISNERKNLFQHFDTAFVDIFPDYIEVVNSYLKPEMRITPKRTEILNTELRILALIKLGIEDNGEIAEMLHCSVKTVMNQKAVFRSRLAVPENIFTNAIMEL